MSTKRKPRLDLNPSSADRWTTCTASPWFIYENHDRIPADTGNDFSREGTAAHEVASAFLLDREPDPKSCPVPVDADMLWHGWNYAEYVTGLRHQFSRLLVEQKLPLWYMPGRNAIVDVAVLNPQELHIVDYKYGAGIPVSPENNLQLVTYMKCVVAAERMPLGHEFPVHLHIYQPRGRNTEAAQTWSTTWGEVQRIAKGLESAALGIQEQTMTLGFSPSEKACQWCPASGFCSARQKTLTKDIEALTLIDDSLTLTEPKHGVITMEQLAAVLKHKDQIVKWLNDAEKYAVDHLKNGGTIPGFKLVKSRGGNRYWLNPKNAERLLVKDTILKREDLITESMIGPAAVEKLLGKNKFPAAVMDLIAKPPGQPVIAPEDDPRESCLEDGKDDFDTLDF